MRASVISFLLFSILFQGFAIGQQNKLSIFPCNSSPVIDGIIEKEAWEGKSMIQIQRSEDWNIDVLATYDHKYLYIVFCNVQGENLDPLNAEVLLQTGFGNNEWDANTYWFHASYGNCVAQGDYYNWEECSNNPRGWQANTYPLDTESPNFEFRISYSRLGIPSPRTGQQLGIAFKLSSVNEEQSYWPKDATIEDPSSWGNLIFN